MESSLSLRSKYKRIKPCVQTVNDKNTETHILFTQPPPSVPTAAETNPDATSAAGPEEDPPVYLSVECGFLTVLWKLKLN